LPCNYVNKKTKYRLHCFKIYVYLPHEIKQNKMKKLFLVFAFVSVAALTACNSAETTTPEETATEETTEEAAEEPATPETTEEAPAETTEEAPAQ
jgi:hypothetical protein